MSTRQKSQEWILKNFESLVSKYRENYIGVVDEEVVSVVLTPREVIGGAKKAGIDEEEVSLLKVPTEEELIYVL